MKRIAYRLFILLYLLCVPNMLWAIQVMYDTICWQPTYSFMGADYPLPAYQSHQNEKYMHVVLEYRDTIECEKYRLFLSIIPFEHGTQRAINDTIVNGETYDFFGQQLTAEGTYNYTEQTPYGCQFEHVLYLTVLDHYTKSIQLYLCPGDTVSFEGKDYYRTGIYYDTISDANSVKTVYEITIIDAQTYANIQTHICKGEKFAIGDKYYTEPGLYIDTIGNVLGCDSIVHLQLDVLPSYLQEYTYYLYPGETYEWQQIQYTQPGVYTKYHQAINGCDSILVLRLLENRVQMNAIHTHDHCADDGYLALQLDVEGLIDSLDLQLIIHNPDTIASIPYNQKIAMPADGNVFIPINNIRAGIYDVLITAYYHGYEVLSIPTKIRYLYPTSVLEQRWDDVICVLTNAYNGGYDFAAFQWYKNGIELSGETQHFLHQPLEHGAYYTVLLTETNGTQLFTCPLYIEERTEAIVVEPTLVSKQQPIRCFVPQMASVLIYNETGQLLSHYTIPQGENYLLPPNLQGIYLMKIILLDNHQENVKIIVQ